MHFENFKSNEDIIREYEAPIDALDNAIVHLAWYGYGSYSGSSLVIFEKNDTLYQVNGRHCSCYGLEGQWKPEETSWQQMAKRDVTCYNEYRGEDKAQEYLSLLTAKHLPN